MQNNELKSYAKEKGVLLWRIAKESKTSLTNWLNKGGETCQK